MKTHSIFFFLSIVLLAGCLTAQNNKGLEPIHVEQGLLLGVPGSDPSVTVYKGVPFAAPPVGNLRWRAPQPPAAWDGVRTADKFSANAIQVMVKELGPWTPEYQPQGPTSEDCLYLNIWTAAKSSTEMRPVMVYIPGGAFTGGSGNCPVYDGEALAKKGVIVVTVNYRVGVIGFLALPELTKESEHHSSGNYGLLDQVAALGWVKKNIAAFGGDPNNVTIVGQSAGAMSVHCLIASPLAKGLFHRAIAQSGSNYRSGPGQSLTSLEQTGLQFAKAVGAASLSDLRAMSAEDLLAASTNKFSFRPVVDGWLLPKSVDEIIAEGKQNDVATLTGWVADEGSYNDTYGKLPAEEFRNQVQRQAGTEAVAILQLYPAATDAEAAVSQKNLSRDIAMVSMYLWAATRRQTAATNAYTYFFTHMEPGETQQRYLTFHSSELPYVFDNLKQSPRPWTAEDRHLAEELSDYWVNFISSGNPNGKGLPEWPAFNPKRVETMELGETMGPRPLTSQEKFRTLEKLLQNSAH